MHAPDPSTFIAAGASAQVFRLDGGRVLIVSGAGAGQRIVTQGADLLDHVR